MDAAGRAQPNSNFDRTESQAEQPPPQPEVKSPEGADLFVRANEAVETETRQFLRSVRSSSRSAAGLITRAVISGLVSGATRDLMDEVFHR